MTNLTWVLSSCVLILAVIAIRAGFGKRIRPGLRYALWGLVLLRLLYPGTVSSSPVSVQSVAEKTEVVQNFEAVRDFNSIKHMDGGSVEGYLRDAFLTDYPSTVAEQVTPERFTQMETAIRVRDILEPVWHVGIAVTVVAFLVSNLNFHRALCKRRKPLDAECPLRVYSVESLSSSCLFGNAIYVAAETAMDETRLRHVLAHELSHYLNCDHIWALLRCAALALHWYNPLVWWAAALSRQDSELCADAGALKRLGENERENYGATLIELSARRAPKASLFCTATTMTNGKKLLKERVTMIAHRPRMTAAVVIAVVAIAAAAADCTFAGAATKADTSSGEQMALEIPPDDYSLEQAKADGCVVMEDGQITAGKERFLHFTENPVQDGSVRIVHYYTLGDPSRYAPEHYEEIRDTYPCLFVHDLIYNGKEGYIWRGYEDGELIERQYSYMLRMVDPPDGPAANWNYAVRYVLVNDADVTWKEIWTGMISSQSGDAVDHITVYEEYVYVSDETPASALIRALRGELAFPLDTSQTRSYVLDHEVTLPELTMEDSETMERAAFTFIDFDGDGIDEAVYQRSDYRGFYVLRWWEGRVYGYEFNYRGMMALKQDGTFRASGGASDNGYSRLCFTGADLSVEDFMWLTENGSGGSYTLEGESVSRDEYFRAIEAQDAKPDADWQEYTSENLVFS